MSSDKVKNKVIVEGTLEFKEAITYLENLVGTLKSGSARIEQGVKSVTLTPTNIVDFKIEAKQKEGKEKLSIMMAWADDGKYGVNDGVNISSGNPKAETR